MVPDTVEQLLSAGSESAIEKMLADHDTVFFVDWREEDDAIVGYCEGILKTGDLAAELIQIDADPGFEIYIAHRGRRVKVPLVIGLEDRHITLYTLNELLKPAFEIRVCVDSNGSDTLAFLPLSGADWSALDARFGDTVARHFRKVEERPNLFTDPWSAVVSARDDQPLQRTGAAKERSWLQTLFGCGPGR
jgi:hypothetical protein